MSSPHYKPKKSDKTPKADGSCFINGTDLEIIWGGDKRYWKINDEQNGGSVELLQVSWLEVTGSVPFKCLKKSPNYKLSFKLKLKNDAFGWDDSPVYFMVKPGENYVWRKAVLSKGKSGETQVFPHNLTFSVTNDKSDQGDDKSDQGELLFGMYEIWRGRWKGGLIIEGVEITPVETKPVETKPVGITPVAVKP